ncbi:recombinase family protein [Clostridium sp. D2Q-11]|uniref:Recombinase family protein n=1 Tax=Anaeromonas frigoriresistens TaxID=2683708 RepID=A0A942Z861_9FIRM|nr:recombinase family protein [Anaeromonas frigoriresistens]MBS4539452.1 recombinase family protein [Anaeromonas frigoriresistens]
MVYGYARVSTSGQVKDGNSLESQEKILKEHGAEVVYSDSVTGKNLDRPNLKILLSEIKEGDILIVTKLDRIARSLTRGSELVNMLIDDGIKVHILNVGIMDNTPSSRLIRNIFFSFAEFERDMIVERTQEGKMIARQSKNFKEGRPLKFNKIQIEHALQLLEHHTYKQVEQMTGISKSTLVRAKRKNKLGID